MADFAYAKRMREAAPLNPNQKGITLKSLYVYTALAAAAMMTNAHAGLVDLTVFKSEANVDVQPNLLTLQTPYSLEPVRSLTNILSFDYELTYANSAAKGEIYLTTDYGYPIVYRTTADSGSSGWQTFRFDQPYSGFFTIIVGGPNVQVATLQIRNMLDSSPVAAVPEPESYAMVLAGLGMLGAVVRRRAFRSTRRAVGIPV